MNSLTPPTINRFIPVGSIGSPFGIHGYLKIYSYTEPYTNIIHYRPWYLLKEGHWQALNVSDCKQLGKKIIAHFEGCDSPEQAKDFVNRRIAIQYDQLPKLENNEFYWADLMGLDVFNTQQKHLGKIDHLFETGANDVMVIKNQSREYLIPYVLKHIILDINLEHKTMTLDWDEE